MIKLQNMATNTMRCLNFNVVFTYGIKTIPDLSEIVKATTEASCLTLSRRMAHESMQFYLIDFDNWTLFLLKKYSHVGLSISLFSKLWKNISCLYLAVRFAYRRLYGSSVCSCFNSSYVFSSIMAETS